MGAALPAASAASGSRTELPLQPGTLAAKLKDRQIAAQAAAAEPGRARPAKPPLNSPFRDGAPRVLLSSTVVLRFARLAFVSGPLKEEK